MHLVGFYYENVNQKSNQYTTPPANQLHPSFHHIAISVITPHSPNYFNSQEFNHYPFLTCICITENNFNQNYDLNCYVMTVTELTIFVILYSCIRASPWWCPECRPKHFGEKIVNKVHQKYWVTSVGYLYILDQINERKMGHIKTCRPATCFDLFTANLGRGTQ